LGASNATCRFWQWNNWKGFFFTFFKLISVSRKIFKKLRKKINTSSLIKK
jgi:hypothetical protein